MTTTKTILVATDLSAPARHAVERAFVLAVAGSELHMLHVLELDTLDSLREMMGGDISAIKAALEGDAREGLARLADDLASKHGVAPRACVALGNPLATIAARADALDASLVVLGARGESFLRHALLGSTASRLLRKSVRCPVLVVKQAAHQAYRSILIAVDFSPASLDAIRLVKQFVPDADIVLLHAFELPYESKLMFAGVDEQVIRKYVVTAGDSRRKQLHDLAARAQLAPTEYSARVIHGDPSLQIMAMEQEYDVDLIVVGKHGIHMGEELLLGSVTNHVLDESQCDVLVIGDRRLPEDQSP